jgi:tetratricopeptide (TPR) repeat protein
MSNEQAQEFLNQATQSVQSGQFDQALTLVDQCLALDPSNGDAYLLRGIALSQTKQPDLAQAAFRAAADLMPGSPKPLFNLAVHLYGTGYKREAYDSANEALRLDPSHAQARDLANRLQQELGIPAPGLPHAGPEGAQAQNPYTQPAAGYYRPGYEAQPGVVHSIGYVEKMGDGWNKLGLGLVIGAIVMFVGSFAARGMMPQPNIQPGDNPFAAIAQIYTGPMLIMAFVQLIFYFVSIWWIVSDIADRRGNWLWLVGYLICCCCAPIHVIYFFAGRKQN